MTDLDAPLTSDQEKLMAYVDDEMSPEERTEFEKRLAAEPELATDHEMRRFWESFYNRSEWQIGWILLITGVVILGGYGVFELLRSGQPLLIKIAALAALAGGGILFWNTLRLKMRTSRFDRYRGVMR